MKNIYRSALDVINTSGWCQGRLTNKLGHVCLMGALNCVRTATYEELWVVYDTIHAKLNINSIASWNDAPTTKREDVINLLTELADEFDRSVTQGS